jgi:lysyl-tRNA synthetase class II
MSSIHHWNKNKYKPWISAALNKEFLMEKSPKELEKIGREHGIELDRRLKIETLVDKLYDVL